MQPTNRYIIPIGLAVAAVLLVFAYSGGPVALGAHPWWGFKVAYIGVPIGEIGWIVGTLGPLSMLVTSAVSIPLMRYMGLVRSMLVFAALAFVALLAMAYGFSFENHLVAIVGAVAIGAGVSGIYVILATKIIGWSAGTQPATDYAAYYGISRFGSTLMTVAAAQVVPLVNWGLFYAAGAAALFAMVFLLLTLIGRND